MKIKTKIAATIGAFLVVGTMLSGCGIEQSWVDMANQEGTNGKLDELVYDDVTDGAAAQESFNNLTEGYAGSMEELQAFIDARTAEGFPMADGWEEGVYLATTGNEDSYIVAGTSDSLHVIMVYRTTGMDRQSDWITFDSVDEYRASTSPVDGLALPNL